MAGILDSLFGDLQGTGAGGLLGLLGGGGGIGTATRRLRTPEEEQQAALKGDYLGVTPQVPQAFGGNLSLPSQVPSGFPATAPPQDYVGTPGALDPKWQALLAGNTDPYQPNAQLPPTATPTVGAQKGPGVTLPQLSDGGFGRDTGPQNPLMGLLGGIGNLFGASSAQAAPAPGAAQQPGIPAQAAAGPAAGPGLFGRLQAGATNLSSGGNPLAGIINAVGGLATGERTDRQGIALQSQAATYQALLQAGLDPGRARAMALNPEVFKAVAPEIFSGYKIVQTGEGPFGEKEFMMQGPGGQLVPLSAMTRGASQDQQGGSAGTGSFSYLAPGVKQIDSNLVGPDYLNQFSPEVQAAVKNYVEGRSMPTGNPRKGFTQTIKNIASKYGNDIGTQADDTTFGARKKLRDQLSSGQIGSIGGQLTAGNTAIGHLSDMSDKVLALNNIGTGIFGGIPGSAAVAHTLNDIGNSKGDAAPQVNAFNDLRERYVQEITKFYSGSPGAQAERDRAIAVFDSAKTPRELASAIKTEAEAMQYKLKGLESQISGLGPEEQKKYPVIKPTSEKALQHIDENVSRLEKGGPAPKQQQGTPSQLRPIDKAAIDWANANPKDPRAAAIKQRLGVQ